MKSAISWLKYLQKKLYQAKLNIVEEITWLTLKEPKIKGAIPHDAQIQNEIKSELKKNGYTVVDLWVDAQDYRSYLEKAEYNSYRFYYSGDNSRNLGEKTLEHYLAAKLLNLSSKDRYIDIASSNSPVAEIYQKAFSCETYRLDLFSSQETKSNMIIGDAGNMPLKNSFATKMALHCSFEHFEQDADIRFLKEANRVLCPGGKVCIIPLYLFNKYAIQTDPFAILKANLNFEKDATLYLSKGYGNRQGRFYDVYHLTKRIRDNLGDFKLKLFFICNEREINSSCYAKFVAIFEKAS